MRPAATGLLCPLLVAHGEVALARELVREVLPARPGTDPGDIEFATAMVLQRAATTLALDAGDLPVARAWLAAHDRWLPGAGRCPAGARARSPGPPTTEQRATPP